MTNPLINQEVVPIVLASQSKVRADILRRAGLNFHVEPANIDEEMIREGMEAEEATSAHIAETLAEMKALLRVHLGPGVADRERRTGVRYGKYNCGKNPLGACGRATRKAR